MSDVGYIIIIKRSGKDGDSYPLCQTTCTIGKHLESNIRVQLDSVSAKHACISVLPEGKCILQSLSATNPVQVNGVPLSKSSHKLLAHKDVITVGDRLLRWEYSVSSPLYPPAQSSAFAFSTPTKFVGMGTPRNAAGSASIKKRKMSSLERSESSGSERKRVSFGPYLSPEQFDQQLPTSTPVRKGEKPNFSSPIPVASPMVLGLRQQVKTTQGKDSPLVATPKGSEDTPAKSLLRRRSPTPIKPYLARSLGFAVITSAFKKTPAKSPTPIRSLKTSSTVQPKSPKVPTPSLILKQRKLVKSNPSPSKASSSSREGSRAHSESPRAGRSVQPSKALSGRSRSVGPAVKGGRDFPASRVAKLPKRSISPKSAVKLVKSSNKLKTPKKRRESSFTVTPKVSPKSSPGRVSSPKKEAQMTSFTVTSLGTASPNTAMKGDNSLSPKNTPKLGTTKAVKTPVRFQMTPAKTGEVLKTLRSGPKSTPSPKNTPKFLVKKTASPKATPKSLVKKSPLNKTLQSLKKRTPSPKKTPKSLKKRTPSPKKTSKSLKKRSPSPKKTPESLKKKTPPKKTPKSLKKKTPSPKKTPKSLKKKTPKKNPTSLTQKTSKKTPQSLKKTLKSPKSLIKSTSPISSARKQSLSSPKSALKTTPVLVKGLKTSPKQKLSDSRPSRSTSKASVLAHKSPRLAWGRSSFASVVKRGGGAAKQHSATARRALQAVVKAREFKAKKNAALSGKPKQTSDLQLTQDIPKKFHFGAVSSTGHANSPAPIIIYKKTQKTPEVFRKGRKSVGHSTASAGALDLSGVEALMATPVMPSPKSLSQSPKQSPLPKSFGHTPKSASNSPTPTPRSDAKSPTLRSAAESSAPSLESASMSRSLRSASRSLSPRSASRLSDRSPKPIRKSLPSVSQTLTRTLGRSDKIPLQVAESSAPESLLSTPRATEAQQSDARPSHSVGSQHSTSKKAVDKSTGPVKTPVLKSHGRVVKTPKSIDSSLRMVRSLAKTPQGSKSASRSSASLRQTLLSMETGISSPASLPSSVALENNSQSSVASSVRTPYNSPNQPSSSPLFMPSLAENGSRLGDFTSRKSLGIHPTEPQKTLTRRARSLGGSGELTPTQLRKLFTANTTTQNAASSNDLSASQSATSSPSSRSSSRLDFTSVETPNISQERFISPLGTPHYKQPDPMLLSSLAAKRTPFSPAAASPSIRAPGSNVAIVNPIQQQVTEERNQSPIIPSGKLLSGEKSPYSSYCDVEGMKQLLRTPHTPKDDLRNVSGLKTLFQKSSPAADYTNVQNIKQIFTSSRRVSLSDSTLASLSALMKSPTTSEPLLEIHEVLNVVTSPPKQSTPSIQIASSTLLPLSSVRKSPATDKAPVLVDLSSDDDDVDQPPQSEVPRRASRPGTPASAARGTKRTADALDESPMRRNTRGRVGQSPISKKADLSANSVAESPAKSSVNTQAKSPVRTDAKSPVKTPAKSPTKTVAKSPAKTVAKAPEKAPAESPVLKSPSALDKSSEKSYTESLTQPPVRRTRGRPAKADPPITKAVTPPTPKVTRRGRRGKTVTAPSTQDASPNSTSTPSAPVVSPKVTRRGRGAALKKIASPVVASPSQSSLSKSPTPVKRATRGRRVAAVVSTPVNKTTPAKKAASSKKATPVVISPVKILPQSTMSTKNSTTPVKRTTRGRRAAAVISTSAKLSPAKKATPVKKSSKEETPIKGTPESAQPAEKLSVISPKKTRGRKAKTVPAQLGTPVKTAAAVTSEEKSPVAKRPSRSRAAAKKASPPKTKAAVAKKDSPQKIRNVGSKATPQESEESSPVKVSPVKPMSSPPVRKATRGRRAAAKVASPKSPKTPSPARSTRQTRRRAAQK